ncbi:PorT family protein [Hymenobacter sp. J193]|uniref:porin family protein n=1 Tax=Hymenobacter sp. J193 TaxID=2898429 RepID=UPI0021513B83|nr:porin family protein [Hymenobacter sp. J193]MCR5887652.1 PorT family protein [Hymenobacter sp. J193]
MKHIFLLLLLTGFTIIARAQQTVVGMRGGFHLSTYTGPGSGGSQLLPGGTVGITTTSSFNSLAILVLQAELLYSGKGAKALDNGIAARQRLHYLELPVLLQYRINHLELEAGPQFGFLVAQRTKVTYPNGSYKDYTTTSGLGVFQAGFIVGAAYRAKGGLGFGLRYNGGISDMAPYSGEKNMAVQGHLSYLFSALPMATSTAGK